MKSGAPRTRAHDVEAPIDKQGGAVLKELTLPNDDPPDGVDDRGSLSWLPLFVANLVNLFVYPYQVVGPALYPPWFQPPNKITNEAILYAVVAILNLLQAVLPATIGCKNPLFPGWPQYLSALVSLDYALQSFDLFFFYSLCTACGIWRTLVSAIFIVAFGVVGGILFNSAVNVTPGSPAQTRIALIGLSTTLFAIGHVDAVLDDESAQLFSDVVDTVAWLINVVVAISFLLYANGVLPS